VKRNEAAAIVFQRFGSVKANLTRIQAQNLFLPSNMKRPVFAARSYMRQRCIRSFPQKIRN
jgi:hypothetical protein